MNKNSTKNKTKKISQKENETSKILQLLDSLEAEQYGTKSKTAQLGKTEQSLEALSQTVVGHTTSIGNHTNAIQNLSSKAVAQGYAIDALQGKDLDHDTAIATNTANIATNTANIATNASGILALQSGKQDKLTAGQNVTIQNNTISASVDTSALQPKLTAGANITIDQNNQISATNTTYTAGTNINIDANNVISATGGGSSSVTASNVDSESATSGQVLTADGQGGATWQTVSGGSGGCDCAGDIAFLRDYATGIDIYRTCVAPTTYPVGTIFQTYDCYERELSCTKYTTGNLPKILFCVEPNSTGKINLSFNYSITPNVYSAYIRVKLNNSLIREDYIQIESVNTIYSYSVSIDNVQFNTTDRNNDLVVEFALDTTYSNTKKIVFSYYRAEIIAPNIDILNKIDPFWAIEIGGNYYVTDCTTGRAMYAEIDAMRIKKTSDLVWHDAGFNAQRYERIAFYNKTNNQLLPYKYARITTTKNLSWTIRYDGSSDYISYNDACYYMSQLRTYSSNYYYFTNAWDNSANVYGANFGNNLKSIYLSISGDYVKAVGGYILNPDANNDIPSCFVFAFTESNGNTKLHTKFASYNLGYYTDVKIYITSYTGEYNFDFDIYLKKFGKIYKKSFHYDNTNHFTFISEIELGIYDSYYRMPNNDYFVVNHGRILYFKDPK